MLYQYYLSQYLYQYQMMMNLLLLLMLVMVLFVVYNLDQLIYEYLLFLLLFIGNPGDIVDGGVVYVSISSLLSLYSSSWLLCKVLLLFIGIDIYNDNGINLDIPHPTINILFIFKYCH